MRTAMRTCQLQEIRTRTGEHCIMAGHTTGAHLAGSRSVNIAKVIPVREATSTLTSPSRQEVRTYTACLQISL